MIITQLQELAKGKCKVYIDEAFAFVLYKKELKKYEVKIDRVITQETYEEIQKEIVIPRAKKATLHLLTRMDRTEEQIRTKLKQYFYTEDIIRIAIAYVKSYGYINDEQYAHNYLEIYGDKKSQLQLKQDLVKRGISKEIIKGQMDERGKPSEKNLIDKIIQKKGVDLQCITIEQQRKLYGFLMRKGFQSDDIRSALLLDIR